MKTTLLKTMLRKFMFIAALWSATVVAVPAYGEIVVIVRADSHVPYDDLLVEKIFLVQTLTLPDGSKAEPVHQKDGSSIHSEFVLNLLNKAPTYIRSGWSKLTFTGGLKSIKELSDDDAVIKYVENTPNGVGYVDARKVKGNVRVIMKL